MSEETKKSITAEVPTNVADTLIALTEWHEERVNELREVTKATDKAIVIDSQEIPGDSRDGALVRMGIALALGRLGTLPVQIREAE